MENFLEDSDSEDDEPKYVKEEFREEVEETTLVTIVDDCDYDEEANPKTRYNFEMFFESNNDLQNEF